MLEYLVTSKVRRRLLVLLWGEQASGSVAALAERAHVAFAGAYRELHKMVRAGVATSKRVDGAEVFAANDAHPLADALRGLVSEKRFPLGDADDDHTRNALFTLGAPTFGEEVPVEDVEYALVQGVALSHRDGTVASVLPLVFYRQRDRVAPGRLVHWARDLGEKRALGFFLDLTSEVSGDQRFAQWAKSLRDRRCSDVKYLFNDDSRSPLSRAVADRNTPAAARRWNLRANTTFDTFKSTFEKHLHA